jgi:membrane protein YqaA with SNARE-associated domain
LHSIKLIFAKYSAYVLGLLGHLGIWGPLVLAMLDSGAFGIPMDPVMIGYAWRDRHQLWLVVFYCLTASVGSAIGSLLPYAIGRAGGELLLLKRIDRQRLDKMRDRFESQEFIFMMIPAMLPPPTPFKLFVLCAGVFEMRVVLFALAIATGRLIRFAITSYLVIRFGPDIVRVIMNTAQHHLVAALATLILFVTVGLVWRKLHKRRRAARGSS